MLVVKNFLNNIIKTLLERKNFINSENGVLKFHYNTEMFFNLEQ